MMLYETPIRLEIRDSNLFVNDRVHNRAVRTLMAMRDVLQDQEIATPETDLDLYYMFRNVYFFDNMRYDLVLMPARFLGNEYNKTYGHYHPIAENKLSYPEVYQVLKGDALFLLQKKCTNASFEVVYASAKSGDVVLIPPNYGHITINKSDNGDLVLANLVYDKFESMYDDYKASRGAAFYYTKSGFSHNQKYIVRKFDRITPAELNKKYDFTCNDLLRDFCTFPQKFRFLEKPGIMFK